VLALGVHRIAHRVFLAVPDALKQVFKIDEVLLGPLELETMRWGRHPEECKPA
jgi:hypothetical protein